MRDQLLLGHRVKVVAVFAHAHLLLGQDRFVLRRRRQAHVVVRGHDRCLQQVLPALVSRRDVVQFLFRCLLFVAPSCYEMEYVLIYFRDGFLHLEEIQGRTGCGHQVISEVGSVACEDWRE